MIEWFCKLTEYMGKCWQNTMPFRSNFSNLEAGIFGLWILFILITIIAILEFILLNLKEKKENGKIK